ncbi:bifunctional 2-polyprenyl-6-hydroxyphenol methylase/3-demethylubiquinol 3-O-methyltransferase UbiG [Haloarcula sp. JP-L23]|uniref:class I SAM-dependent methyltransferase n=1 Tax=Haloarcula sp. JP-L23 TaxID=2716717 RepID=UPI00140EE02B|nr:class I SAM-dependent methyltransferase [Haloarcula sp. JP-L23]
MDSNDVRSEWAERSGEYSPTYYAHYGPDETSELVQSILETEVGREASVLEVGCGVGRHLAALADAGFSDLTGVDVNPAALDVLAETYPELAETGSFHAEAIEEYATDVADDAFDAVYSVETLQHIHPDVEWVFDDIARIAGELVVTVENESGEYGEVNYVDDDIPLYYRDWHRVFTDRGFVEVTSSERKRDTVRVFRPSE